MAKKQTQCVFGLRDVPLHAGDLRCRRVEQLFRLPDVQPCRDAAVTPQFGQSQTIDGYVSGAPGDRQLPIERLEREVRVGHVGDERDDDAAPCLFGREVLGACGLVQAAQATPDVQLPRHTESGLDIGNVRTESRRQRPRANLRDAVVRGSRRSDDHRKLVGVHDVKAFACLQHALRSNLQVEVLCERGAHELHQRVVLEKVEPLHVGERTRTRLGGRCGCVAIRGRHADSGPPVVRTERARSSQHGHHNDEQAPLHGTTSVAPTGTVAVRGFVRRSASR